MGKTVKKVVIGALVAAAVATGVGLIGGAIGLGSLTMSGAGAYFARQFAINAVLGMVSSALTPKPENLTGAADLSGQTIMQRNTLVSRKIVYGQVKTSGAVVFMEATDNNENLHYIVTMAGHEITGVNSVFFNDQIVKTSLSEGVKYAVDATTDPDYSGKAWVTAHFGDEDQTADSNLVSETSMTTNHRLRGIAYLYTKLSYDQDVFTSGVPNVSAIVNGRAVYDPRTTSTVYSNNAALCILDYLRDAKYGIGATDAEIDFDSFITAANICDEDVTITGGTEKRYTINGVIDTAKQPAAILQDMLSAMAGTIYYANGQWKVRAGAYVTPTETLSMDDIVGQIKVTTRVTNQANFNAVKGVFLSPDDNWQPVDYPSVTSSTFEAEDNGVQRFVDVTLPFTTSSAMAQRLAKISLYRNREQLTLSVPCNLKAFKYEVGDTLYFTNERFGFTNKIFEVVGWELANDGEMFGVNLLLKETSSTVYSWSVDDEKELTRNNTTLPSASSIPEPSITASDELRSYNEEVITTLVANVQSSSVFADRFEVQASNGGDWINLGQASGNRFELLQVQDNTEYTIRARAISGIGVRSAWHTVTHQVVGKTAPPSDVTGLTGNLVGNQYILTWDAVPDLDLSYYRIRFASADGDQDYSNSVSLVPKVARPSTSAVVPARNGTYFVKAVDKLGLASENPATIVLSSNMDAVEQLNSVQTIQEHPDFVGSFDGVVELDEQDRLVLNTTILFDSVTGLFDDAEGLFDGGTGGVDNEGFYYFDDTVDLGDTFISRVTANVAYVRLDYVVLFDSTTGLFDSRSGYFDGDVNAFDDCDVQIQVRTTDDDPSGTPTWTEWQTFAVSDVKARAMQFRAKLTTTDTSATPAVSQLSVSIDMPTRIVRGDDVQTSASAYNVTFSDGAFLSTPSIGIGAQDMQTGDYYEITSKTASGFVITFKNSGGSAVARSFDYVASGHGRVIS